MSYARFSKESDVYAYATGTNYQIHVNIPEEKNGVCKNVSVLTLKEFYDTLNMLKSNGVRIPEYTFERIENELFSTDVC